MQMTQQELPQIGNDGFIPVRIFFSKTGRAKYTSHLDTMRAITRAAARSKLPFWYTQGFNPHLYMTFALPIALGYEGLRESLDARLTKAIPHEEIARVLGRVMPPGFAVLEAAAPVMDADEIAWADYEIALSYRLQEAASFEEKLRTLLRQPVLEVTKRTKKGDTQLDILPLLRLLHGESVGERLLLRMRFSSGNRSNVNPTLFLKAFYDWCDRQPEGVKIVRTAIYNGDLQIFA